MIKMMMFVEHVYVNIKKRYSELYRDIERPAEKIWPAIRKSVVNK